MPNASVTRLFPDALPAPEFVASSYQALQPYGFNAENTIACAGTCRDELCQPLVAEVARTWGEAFNFAGLAGMLLLGRTGFRAAHAHAPQFGGRQRYAYVVMPHIGVGESGNVGECARSNLSGVSHACGALCGLHAELLAGQVDFGLDPNDPEISLVRMRLARRLRWGHVPSLLELTDIAGAVILDDLERMIRLTVDPGQADYAVLSGLLIHAPDQRDYVRPDCLYAVVQGERHALKL